MGLSLTAAMAGKGQAKNTAKVAVTTVYSLDKLSISFAPDGPVKGFLRDRNVKISFIE